jgi:hypothetical protein
MIFLMFMVMTQSLVLLSLLTGLSMRIAYGASAMSQGSAFPNLEDEKMAFRPEEKYMHLSLKIALTTSTVLATAFGLTSLSNAAPAGLIQAAPAVQTVEQSAAAPHAEQAWYHWHRWHRWHYWHRWHRW